MSTTVDNSMNIHITEKHALLSITHVEKKGCFLLLNGVTCVIYLYRLSSYVRAEGVLRLRREVVLGVFLAIGF